MEADLWGNIGPSISNRGVFVCRYAENELRGPDHGVESDVRRVQVPADGHGHHRPVGLHQGHGSGPHARAV